MSDLLVVATDMEQIPGESFLLFCLQKKIQLIVGGKTLKRGRLILFKRTHYFIQLCLLNDKGARENIEIPIPFNHEEYIADGVMYFDYRLSSLKVSSLPPIPDKVASNVFNKILEINVAE